MDDLLEDSSHLQAAICKEAVEAYATHVSQRQVRPSLVLPIRIVVHIDLLPILHSACLLSAQLPKKDI